MYKVDCKLIVKMLTKIQFTELWLFMYISFTHELLNIILCYFTSNATLEFADNMVADDVPLLIAWVSVNCFITTSEEILKGSN